MTRGESEISQAAGERMKSSHPTRRRDDRGVFPDWLPERFYRDLWLLIITGGMLLLAILLVNNVNSQAKGRHFTVGFTCAALSAISQEGREVIAGPQKLNTPFERNLERLGYPPVAVRRAQAQAAAQAYVRGISNRIQEQVGYKGSRLIRADGTIDCTKLQKLGNAVSR
jgi:hypothetical protein